ncbi:MAG: peptide ABC transporter substrate-binding protein, partial [Armatimonadota bacterium]|nr:peptide ABC transporter substrate-binding protein [Armatimonadota bacterium]
AGPPADNVLRVPLLADPTTFDPAKVEDGTTIDILQQAFEGLVQWTPQNTLEPALAEKWDVSPDGRTYTFHLRPHVKFQDGNPVTAQDVYYSLRRALDPALKSTVALSYLGDIVGAKELNAGKTTQLSGVKVVDPATVAITIVAPKAYWIYTLTYPTGYIVSKAEAKNGVELTDADDEKGAGTGLFKITEYQRGSKVTLTANPNYWGGAPKLAGQSRPIIKDAGTRHDEYVAGDLDIVDEAKGDLDADEKDANLKGQIKYWPRAATYYLGLNEKTFKPFADVRVRQALAYATDKKRIQSVVLRDKLDIAQDILPEGIPGYDPAFQGIPYDPKKAQALLAAAGFPGGKGFPTISISFRESYPDLSKTVDLLRDMWQQNLGITVQAKQTEWATLLKQEHDNTLDCYHIRWAADYLDQQDYYTILLRTNGGENHTYYSNPKYDALCDKADVERDPETRRKLYRQAARIAADEVPLIPLYYQKDIELVKPYVKNLDDGLMGHLPYKNLTLAK